MATQMQLNAALSRMFGLFLFVVAVGNALVGSLDFAVLFGVVGIVFVSLSGYIRSNPEKFSDSEKAVSDRFVRGIVVGGWALILIAVVVIATIALA